MPSVTVREYNSTTGMLIGNVSLLNFGQIMAGSHTPVKVIDLVFSGLNQVTNIKIGITSSTLDINNLPEDIQEDGSSSNGRFGIAHSDAFDKTISKSLLGRHFAGLNDTGSANNSHNILIGNRSNTVSQFIYLDLEIGNNDLGVASGSYKLFFDFE